MLQSMPPESQVVLADLVQWLGLSTLGGTVGLSLTWLSLPPSLTIAEVRDRHPHHSFESRFAVKNIGRLPAYDVWANVYEMQVVMGAGTRMEGVELVHNGPPVGRLDPAEITEVPVVPQIGMPPGLPLASCAYTLELEYHARILWRVVPRTRKWRIELRAFNDGSFAWQYTPS